MTRFKTFAPVLASGLLVLSLTACGAKADAAREARIAEANTIRTSDPDASIQIDKNVVAYTTENAELIAARKKAADTLPRFVKMLDSGKAGTYTIKFPLTQNGNTEHIWLQVSSVQQGKYIGLLANQPVNGNAYKMGQPMIVDEADVEDWMVRTSKGIYGGYTARYALKDMPKDQADAIRKQFLD